MMDLFGDLRWRGLVHQWTGDDELPALLRERSITLYCGFDPTSDSLHLGSLVQLTMLRRFQRSGHRPIAIAGGATGMIGDPSGRSEERNLLSADELASNLEAIRSQIARFVDFDVSDRTALMLNNGDWLGRMGFIEFLRDVGKHVPVNVMLGKESVRARLVSENGLSYTEFSYMLMQAYDFVHLHRTHGCILQIGGSDQFGNITAGIDLARRMEGAQLYALTTPLITDATGQKFGKTAAGTQVWLSADRTSPYAFYQYLFNLGDDDACRGLRLFTDLPHDDIERIEGVTASAPQQREAQRTLARELTVLVHGDEGLGRAERATAVLFGASIEGIAEAELLEIFSDVPSATVPRDRLAAGLPLTEALPMVGLATSASDAMRKLEAGGVYVNNRRTEPGVRSLTTADLATRSLVVLRAGKKTFGLIRVS